LTSKISNGPSTNNKWGSYCVFFTIGRETHLLKKAEKFIN
jgi:hypothetical protein